MSEIHLVILVAKIIISALATSFNILLITKVNLREELIVKSPKLLSNMFSCDFCLSFWTNMAICLCMFCLTNDADWLVIPIFATPITRLLI